MNTIRISALGLTLFVFLPQMSGAVDFSHEVVPILKKHCAECHIGEKKKGGFSMNTRESILAGSENGKVVEPGKSATSFLLDVVTTEDLEIQMPPKGDRISKTEVEILKRWIDEKLPWESGFSFGKKSYEPPLQPRKVSIPKVGVPVNNDIDNIVFGLLSKEKKSVPPLVDDETFLRRAYLDLIGLLPTRQETESFLSRSDPDKRTKLIGQLLARDADYAAHWLTFWNDLLRNAYRGTGFIDGGRKQITNWLIPALATDMPFDEMVRELVAPRSPDSAGFINGIKWRGEVNASQTREIQFSQNIGQVFLGINMKCASCHDSFVDRWKLEEAYNLASIVSEQPIEIHRCDKGTGKVATASWVFPELGNIDPKADKQTRLQQLAELLVHPENGRTSRTIVNRIWHRMTGRGIVHPVDAMDTEPWSEDLLDHLANKFVASDYDLKKSWLTSLLPGFIKCSR